MSTASNNPRKRAEVHAAEAERLLVRAGQADYDGDALPPGHGDRELLLARAERLTARAQGHALTALALVKVGGR